MKKFNKHISTIFVETILFLGVSTKYWFERPCPNPWLFQPYIIISVYLLNLYFKLQRNLNLLAPVEGSNSLSFTSGHVCSAH